MTDIVRLKGIEYLHDHGIAHMVLSCNYAASIVAHHACSQDLCYPNVLAASKREAAYDPRVTAGKLYIIDFDRARRLELKPGAQGAIALPSTVCRPPPGITHLDPYSWDVYCAGNLLQELVEVCCLDVSLLS